MKQLTLLRTRDVFFGSCVVRRFTFKTNISRDSYALLARENHILSMNFAKLWDSSILFYREDCFECKSPHILAA